MGNVVTSSRKVRSEFKSFRGEPPDQKYLADQKQLRTAERIAARRRRHELRPGGWTIMAKAIGFRKDRNSSNKVFIIEDSQDPPSADSETQSTILANDSY